MIILFHELGHFLLAKKNGVRVNEFCLGMARYKRPKKIIFTTIPRNATGKIEKPKLREMYGATNLVEKETIG